MRIVKSVIINSLVYEMYSDEKKIEDYGITTLFYITVKKNNNLLIKPIEIGNNHKTAMSLFKLIEINQVHPIHIIDVITDYIY